MSKKAVLFIKMRELMLSHLKCEINYKMMTGGLCCSDLPKQFFPLWSCLTAHWLWPPSSKPFTQTLHLEMYPSPSFWKAHCYHPCYVFKNATTSPLSIDQLMKQKNMRPYKKIDMIHCYETICFIHFELNTRPLSISSCNPCLQPPRSNAPSHKSI